MTDGVVCLPTAARRCFLPDRLTEWARRLYADVVGRSSSSYACAARWCAVDKAPSNYQPTLDEITIEIQHTYVTAYIDIVLCWQAAYRL